MRSMDGSRNYPDFPPGGGGEGEGGGGGRRHVVRPRSPTTSYFEDSDPQQQQQLQQQQHKPRYHHQRGCGGPQQRRGQGAGGDASTNEIIRFVRGYHLERESTWLRLQKRAPLPGIGKANHSVPDSSFPPSLHERRYSRTDGDEDDDDDEDFLLDSEVSAIEAGQRDSFRHQFGVVDDLRFASSFNAGNKRHDRQLRPNASYGPPASQSQHRHVVRPLDSHSHVGSNFSPKARARKGWGRSLKQLPPIARDELPERPSAPSPSLTPPGEGEELDSAGEPVDFIDAP